jgi:hypothetical protein
MKSTFTNPPTATHKPRRGVAEVELLLVIPVLLTIVLLCAIAYPLGRARINNSFNAGNDAYAQAVAGRNITPATEPQPFAGIASVHPGTGLPTRFDEATPTQEVSMKAGFLKLQPLQIKDRAILLAPTWHIAPWPEAGTNDSDQLVAWFSDYVKERQPDELRAALGLAEAFPP